MLHSLVYAYTEFRHSSSTFPEKVDCNKSPSSMKFAMFFVTF